MSTEFYAYQMLTNNLLPHIAMYAFVIFAPLAIGWKFLKTL